MRRRSSASVRRENASSTSVSTVDWLRHRKRSARITRRLTGSSGAPRGTDGVTSSDACATSRRASAVAGSPASAASRGAGDVSAMAARTSSARTLLKSVSRSISLAPRILQPAARKRRSRGASRTQCGQPTGKRPGYNPGRMKYAALLLASALSLTVLARAPEPTPAPAPNPGTLLAPGEERHLANLKQLTFGGQNAEAYWSADGTRLIFQSDEGKLPCDQIFTMRADGSDRRRVSNGEGKTTCSFYFPSGDRILYAPTFRSGPGCPPKPDRSRGYVWALDDYDIYTARPDGSDIRPLFASASYDAEATISPDGKKIVFTSARDGDL